MSEEAVFTHGKEFLVALNRGLQQFDVYENNTDSRSTSKDFQAILDSDEKATTYWFNSHTSYSLKYDHSSYQNLDDDKHLMSFGSIEQYENDHIVHCDHENPTQVGAILIGSSHGSWAKVNEVEQDVARSLKNLLLHPSHLAARVDKGLTLLRQVVSTESYDVIGHKVCSKLHTVSIHPLELFNTMRMKSIADSPYQHVYGVSNPPHDADHPRGATAQKRQTRSALSSIVTLTTQRNRVSLKRVFCFTARG